MASANDSMSHLHVRVVSGRRLPIADPNGLSDPYVKVKLTNEKRRSKTIDKTLNPEWFFDCSFNLDEMDADDDQIRFEVWDSDQLSRDDFMGQLKFNMTEVLALGTVGGWFELFDEKFDKKVGGEILILISLGGEMDDRHRKAMLDGIQTKISLTSPKTQQKAIKK